MAIIFQEQIKKQRNLIFVFLVLVLITTLILWKGYYYIQQEPGEGLISKHFKKVNVNLEILKHPLLQELKFMTEIPAFEGEIGRENPFIPVQIK